MKTRSTCHARIAAARYLPLLVLTWTITTVVTTSYGQDASSTFTLQQGIQQAVDHNRDLINARLQVDAQSARLKQQTARFELQVNPNGNAGLSDNNETAGYGLTASKKLKSGTEVSAAAQYSLSENQATDGNRQTGRVRLEVNQPLFRNLGSLVQFEPVIAGRRDVLTARRNFQVRLTGLILEVVEQYSQIKLLEQQLALDDQAVERLHRLYLLTKSREAQGKSTRIDTLRVELQLGQARARSANASQRLDALNQDFADLIGLPPDQALALAAIPVYEAVLPDLNTATELAFSNRMDFAQAIQEFEDSERRANIAERELQPDIQFTARYDRFGAGRSGSDAVAFDDEDWFAGLTMASDWNRTIARARIESALTDQQLADIAIRNVRYRISREVRERISACRRARTESAISARNAEIAGDRLRLAQKLYDFGKGNNFDVTEAEAAFVEAELQRLSDEIEITRSSYELLQATGTLVKHPLDLKPRTADDL